ncbi:UNVERIFIED_CONTAM: hypothetical protein QUR53_22460, partial [Salmonella enterica]
MQQLITKSQAEYRLNTPVHRIDEMHERGEIDFLVNGGEPMVDAFTVSQLEGYSGHVPGLLHVQETLAKCEESLY